MTYLFNNKTRYHQKKNNKQTKLVKKLSATLPDSKTPQNAHLVDKKESTLPPGKTASVPKKKNLVFLDLLAILSCFKLHEFLYRVLYCYFFCVADK